MAASETTHECPNCLSELESAESGELWICPVCHFTSRSCPDCQGEMWLSVEAPEGVIIEEGGLPLDRCQNLWICRNEKCGLRIDASDE